MRYRVTINDFAPIGLPGFKRATRSRSGLTLTKAQRIVRKELRRGLALYGNPAAGDRVVNQPWGGRAGAWPVCYRSAHIEAEPVRTPRLW